MGNSMPYYECPVCGGGYVIDPAPQHPKCDRDGAALKRASEASYELAARRDDYEAPKAKPKRSGKAKGR
ncbi:MAG TPA: hypothetical protein VMG99_04825 [Thermoplasmata archaeon]|nr:hypothetical protein [Thermoplasmata archaeon]